MYKDAQPLKIGGKTILFQFVTGENSDIRYETGEFLLTNKFGQKESVALERKDKRYFIFSPDSPYGEQRVNFNQESGIYLEPRQKITMLRASVRSRSAQLLRADEDTWDYQNVLLIDHSNRIKFYVQDLADTELASLRLENYFFLIAFIVVLLGAISIGYSASSMLGSIIFGIGVGIAAFAFLLIPIAYIYKTLGLIFKPFRLYYADKIKEHTNKLAKEFIQKLPKP